VRAVVLVGGRVAATARLRRSLADATLVIAADGGLRHAAALGLAPDLLVGDLDSVESALLALHPGLPVERHPREKDALDLELALDAADVRGARSTTVVGGLTGRLDQTIATLLVVQARHAAGHDHEVDDGRRRVWPLRPDETRELPLRRGERFSLLALDAVAIVSVEGARYTLVRAPLARERALGVSNVAVGRVRVQVHAGAVVVVAPGGRG
jgi:thiamine pyrophosphokinase